MPYRSPGSLYTSLTQNETCHDSWRSSLVAVIFLCLGLAPSAAAGIERVDPPFWWQGFEHTELQLMVTGPDIGRYRPSIDYPGVTLMRSVAVASPNYLFVYLDIGRDAKPGSFDIVFDAAGRQLVHRYELRAKNDDPDHTKSFTAADAIYLITPDRFANGDPGNDNHPALADKANRDDDYGRHGGDLAGIDANLDYISELGFTQLWLNPILENAMPESSYHGYATTDFYEVDPRYGDNEQYRRLVAEARARGIGMIMDMIANHIGVGHPWMADIPTPDWIGFGGEFRVSNHARTTHQDPYASAYDKAGMTDGWFAAAMPDLNQRNPLLADYLIQNAIWWIEYLGLAGIRMDTWPYPDKSFMAEWARRITEEYPHFNIVGEEWSANPAVVSYWQRGKTNSDGYVSHLPSLFDFPGQMALRDAFVSDYAPWEGPWYRLYQVLGSDHLYPDPFGLVIMVDNHDMNRIYTQVAEDYALYRMAMVYLATMRGIPQFFYGTEILLSHPGTDSHGALRMDFPGGWPGDRVNGFTGKGLRRDQREAQALIRRLFNWRKQANVIHDGKLMHYTPLERQVYAYFRYDERDTVMVIMNRGDDTIDIDMARFEERLGAHRFATDVLSGKRFNIERPIKLDPKSVLLLEIEN